jgi:hypothetical protein
MRRALSKQQAQEQLLHPLVWLFNLVGITDLLFAMYNGAVTGLPFFHLGVAWLLLTFYVPLLLVSHVIVFWLLLRAAPSAPSENATRESLPGAKRAVS